MSRFFHFSPHNALRRLNVEKLFKLKEHKTNVRTEIIAGITTFLTMSYIIFVQPAILSNPYGANMDFGAVMVATCLAAALATFVMAFLANYPIALAPGMGQNVYFSFIVCGIMGFAWPQALGAVFIAGAAFLILSIFRVREKVIEAIPHGLKLAISGGIGLLIAMVGLQYAGLIVDDPSVLVRLGSPTTPWALLSIFGLVTIGVLMARKVKGAMLIGMVVTAILGLFMYGYVTHPENIDGYMAGLEAQGMQVEKTRDLVVDEFDQGQLLYAFNVTDSSGEVTEYAWGWRTPDGMPADVGGPAWARLSEWEFVPLTVAAEEIHDDVMHDTLVQFQGVVDKPPSIAPTFLKLDIGCFFSKCAEFWLLWEVVFIFFFMDLFDTIGTLLGVGHAAGFLRKDGTLPKAGPALISDAVGTVAGAALGTSTVTSYIESSTGVSEGGRTGLANIVTGILFILAIFFKPLAHMVGGGYDIDPDPAGFTVRYPVIAAPLIIVGSLMMKGVKAVEWDDPALAISAFITIIIMPLTFSIATGISFGFIAYVLIKLLSGKAHEVHWILYLLAVIFILRYAFIAV